MEESYVVKTERAIEIIKILQKATQAMVKTASMQIVEKYGRDPYLILISCLLSLRTKDLVSFPASCRLFEHAKTPQQMLKVPLNQIEKSIYPVGFYRNKAKTIHVISHTLINRFGAKVPHTQSELMSLPGVGPKTANLVLGVAFKIPALCVDTHVHRIANRLGLVKTQTPEQTEAALQQVVPKEYWVELGQLLVIWGQNICVPISPKCSECAIFHLCPRIGVTRHR